MKTSQIIGGDVLGSDSTECSLAFSELNESQIYYSLNIEEQKMPALPAQLKHQKAISGLTCVKTNKIIGGDAIGGDKINCSFSF